MWVQLATVDWVDQMPVYTPAGYLNIATARHIDTKQLTNQQGVPIGKWRLEALLSGDQYPTQLLGVFASADEALEAARLLVGGFALAGWEV